MCWESELIEVYLNVCEMWDQGVWSSVQRFSNNKRQILTDQEIMTMYIFGCIRGYSEIKQIYEFCHSFLKSFFPHLKGYDSFCYRLRILSDGFISLCEKLVNKMDKQFASSSRKLIDSMPIVLAKTKRSNQAKVAPELANKGYCASKSMYYYGVKLHILGHDRDGKMPMPTMIGLSPASSHDQPVFEQVAGELFGCDVFGDSAFKDQSFNLNLKEENQVQVVTPAKRKKGQAKLDSADQLYSTAVAQIRQPIESIFSWIQRKTQIQSGSTIRSRKGLIVHTFGKICAGLMMMNMHKI
ncbi:MAG: IS982 family transposase [Pseudoalteromonas sp.]|uniref:IS982 family transposase n=1 Tax=Pseudoalteromonas sp. TaxID=53249 RepID=UPI001D963795|nr:IS982 family transposase [Pseudoalteromonas sp.]NRA81832.1 IS982 family transposase [Pseudoalteromonas sp.]